MNKIWKEVLILGAVTALSSVLMIALVGDISFDKDEKEIFHWVGPLHGKKGINCN